MSRDQHHPAGDLSLASVESTGLPQKGRHRVKCHLQRYITALCLSSAVLSYLRPLQNKMHYPKASSGLGKEKPWEHFEKQSSLWVHLFTLSVVLEWLFLKLQNQVIQINCIHVCIQTFPSQISPRNAIHEFFHLKNSPISGKWKVKLIYFFSDALMKQRKKCK